MKHYLLGLDVGGTKIEAALIELSHKSLEHTEFQLEYQKTHYFGRVIQRERHPTERQKGYDHVIDIMAKLIKDVLQKSALPITSLEGIGLGMPGTIDPRKQVMLNGNTGIFLHKPIAEHLQKKLEHKLPIFLENDATLFALAEAWAGAGAEYARTSNIPFQEQTSIGIILGTGCGGGIVVNGNILQGKNGGGGEIGHTELITGGVPCYCGRLGCAEQYLAGPGIEALYATRIYSQIEKRPHAGEIFEMAANQEPVAKAVIHQYTRYLAKFLANLTNIFDPDYFVLGGGVSKQEILYTGVVEKLMRNDIFVPESSPKIFQHKLGDSAGVIGAALLPLLKAGK